MGIHSRSKALCESEFSLKKLATCSNGSSRISLDQVDGREGRGDVSSTSSNLFLERFRDGAERDCRADLALVDELSLNLCGERTGQYDVELACCLVIRFIFLLLLSLSWLSWRNPSRDGVT